MTTFIQIIVFTLAVFSGISFAADEVVTKPGSDRVFWEVQNSTTRPLYVNTGFNPPISDILDALAREAFGRLGIKINFHVRPGERSLQLVNKGFDDVECCRIPQVVQKDYPELIAVEESLFFVTFSAFVKNSDIKITSWNDLKPYSVGTVKGYKILVNKSKEVAPHSLAILDKPYSMMRMLDLGRIDIAILGYEDGLDAIKQLGIDEKDISSFVLIKKPLHIMLNKKHAGLAQQLSQVIVQMKAEGVVQQITNAVLQDD